MKHIQDLIKSFDDRTETLRKEITEAIIDLLKRNDLTEVRLSQQPDRVPWVVWFDRRNYGYDSRVVKVLLQGKGIAVEVYDEDCCQSETLTSDGGDLACSNIDWLCIILDCIAYTLSLPKSAGIVDLLGHKVEWSCEEPGLAKLPEGDLEQIKSEMQEGKQEGKLCFCDDDDVEFNGQWHLVTEPSIKERIGYLLKKDNRIASEMGELIKTILTENNGRITYPLPEGVSEDNVDYPVSLNLKGDIWNYDLHITSVVLDEQGNITADGFEILDGVKHLSTQIVEPDHYPQILDFITESLTL